jgi:hypothetical protein
MANSNFVVQNGLTVGSTTIFAGNGDISTTGNISVSGGGSFGGLSTNQIYQSSANVTVSGSFVNVAIASTNVASFSSTGLTMLSNFVPSANVAYNSGSTSAYWSNFYAATGNFNTINIGAQGIIPNANLTVNLGSPSAWFNTFYGVSTQAKYADLAENYQADQNYAPGTVLMFGGDQEVTVADPDTTAVAGVVSTNPAHLMNGALSGPNVSAVALVGRVPCNVIGPIKKGDLMISAGFGFARASSNPVVGQVIGKALQDYPGASKAVIEIVVGRV